MQNKCLNIKHLYLKQTDTKLYYFISIAKILLFSLLSTFVTSGNPHDNTKKACFI
jgi:hypothetical protein